MKIQKLVLQVYHFLHHQKKTAQTSLIFISFVLLIFCREISGYFSNYNSEYWFDYFIIAERFSMLLALLAAQSYLKKLNWLCTEFIIAFLIQDFIDRVIFDITTWGINDTILTTVIIVHFIIKKYVKINK